MRFPLRSPGLRRLVPTLAILFAVVAAPVASASDAPPTPSIRIVEESDGTVVVIIDSNGLLASEPTYVVAPAPAGVGSEADRHLETVSALLRSLGETMPEITHPVVEAALDEAMETIAPALEPVDVPPVDPTHAASDVVTFEREDGSHLGSAYFEETLAEPEAYGLLAAPATTSVSATLGTTSAPALSVEAPALAASIRPAAPARDAGPAPSAGSAPPFSASTMNVATPDPKADDPVKLAAATAATGVLGLAAWVLYHRIRESATLNNAARKAIFDAVTANPGLGVQELARVANVSYSTASYHLDRLVEARMLVLANESGRLAYYKNGGSFTESERKVLPLLKNAEAMRVLEAIIASPGTYRAALAESLGVTATTVNWHLKRLVEAGLVTERREGRSARLFVDRTRLTEAFGPVLAKIDGGVAAAEGAPELPHLRRALAADAVAA